MILLPYLCYSHRPLFLVAFLFALLTLWHFSSRRLSVSAVHDAFSSHHRSYDLFGWSSATTEEAVVQLEESDEETLEGGRIHENAATNIAVEPNLLTTKKALTRTVFAGSRTMIKKPMPTLFLSSSSQAAKTTLPLSMVETSTTDYHSYSTSLSTSSAAQLMDSTDCPELPGIEQILVIIKTGATELFAKVPTNLLTLVPCVPNSIIFSDLTQRIGPYQIHDVLTTVSQHYKDTIKDFEFYRDVQRVYAEKGDVRFLLEGPERNKEKGWNLDKWKNIPMMHEAYAEFIKRQNKDIKWFVTIDADTYVSLSNLVQILSKIDHRDPHYIGDINLHGETTFAFGGSGYMISRAALEKLEQIWSPEYVEKWEEETARICCGDVMMSIALKDAGVNVTSGGLKLQTDRPEDIDWDHGIWCEPTVTWHHVDSYEAEALWEFERTWIQKGKASMYLFRDVFEKFIEPNIANRREDWDNGSHHRTFRKAPTEEELEDGKKILMKEGDDWDRKDQKEKVKLWESWSEEQKKSVESEADCQRECQRDTACFQWVWKRHGSCSLNWSTHLGHRVHRMVKGEAMKDVESEEVQVVSGWMIDRIEEFKEKMERERCQVKWKPEKA